MGLIINGYFNLTARQLIIQKWIPFEALAEPDEPTENTKKTLVTAQAKEKASSSTPDFNLNRRL